MGCGASTPAPTVPSGDEQPLSAKNAELERKLADAEKRAIAAEERAALAEKLADAPPPSLGVSQLMSLPEARII